MSATFAAAPVSLRAPVAARATRVGSARPCAPPAPSLSRPALSARSSSFAAGGSSSLRADACRGRAVRAAAQGVEAKWEMENWQEVQQPYLVEKRVPSALPGTILGEAKDGNLTILDVRMENVWDDVHIDIPGTVNVPLFRPLQSWDAKSVMKRLVYLSNAMSGTELNPEFPEKLQAAFPDKSTRIAVVCDAGGSWQALPGFVQGKSSRSWSAIYKMMKEFGYTNVVHIEGGMRQWCGEGMPVVGSDIESWKKRAAQMP